MLEISRDHWLGDQPALEALVRLSEEELKHPEMFRRIEHMIGAAMPTGHRFLPDPNAVAQVVPARSTWAILALTCHIELFTHADADYLFSIAEGPLCEAEQQQVRDWLAKRPARGGTS